MLRDELAAAERRLEDEKFSAASAHQSSAMREQELEVSITARLSPLKAETSENPEHAIRLLLWGKRDMVANYGDVDLFLGSTIPFREGDATSGMNAAMLA